MTYPSTLPSGPHRPRRSKARRIALGVLVGVVAGNALAAGTYVVTNVIAGEPGAAASATVSAVSTAHRTAGLEAMQARDYERATREFTLGLEAPNPAPDLLELLSVARDLGDRSAGQPAERPEPATERAAPARAPAVQASERPAPAPAPVRAVAARARARRQPRVATQPAPTPPVTAAALTPPRPAPTRATPVEARPAAATDELPLCPQDMKPPSPNTPYAALPRRCRPRPAAP
ncbi:MAG: hypothetical protein H6730_19360 [Deltaproteobacteria bacterium]|nr:hypothetical protein [Deltaproteobacteria bacterium]